MSLTRRLCRLRVPVAFIASSYVLSLSLSASRSRTSLSGCSQRASLNLSSSSCPLVSSPLPVLPSFSESWLNPRFTMSKVGSLGSSNLSSSASAIGTTPEDVLEFWFKGVGSESGVYARKEWFFGGPEFDAECEKNFGECVKLASTGAFDGWLKAARGRLALIILLDQVTRNVYRNSASSYAQDETAIKITLETIEQGRDKDLTPWERRFLYMPLMHSENLRHHEIVDRLFEEMAIENSGNEKLHQELNATLNFERKHSAVLKRFGRYPTRNAVLGRPSSKEEEEFLSSGSSW